MASNLQQPRLQLLRPRTPAGRQAPVLARATAELQRGRGCRGHVAVPTASAFGKRPGNGGWTQEQQFPWKAAVKQPKMELEPAKIWPNVEVARRKNGIRPARYMWCFQTKKMKSDWNSPTRFGGNQRPQKQTFHRKIENAYKMSLKFWNIPTNRIATGQVTSCLIKMDCDHQ